MSTTTSRLHRDDGVALVVALMTMTLMLALGTVLLLVTTTETQIAGNHRNGVATLHAADAGIDIAMSSLRAAPRWSDVLTGATTSGLIDGPPLGTRRLGNRVIDLVGESPKDAGTFPWRLYVYGMLDGLTHESHPALPAYVAVWVMGEPGAEDVLTLWSTAFGPGGTRRNVEVSVARMAPDDPASEQPRLRKLTWRER